MKLGFGSWLAMIGIVPLPVWSSLDVLATITGTAVVD